MSSPVIPPVGRCGRRVGYLYPRVCGRTTPVGCADCDNGRLQDPYASRRRSGYDDWESDSDFAGDFAMGEMFGGGDSSDFTEADGESLMSPDDGFEDDLSAS